VLPCGYGKTEVALAVLASVGRKAVIMAPTSLLVDQWCERVRQRIPTATVALMRGSTSPRTRSVALDADIVVTTVQTLALCDVDPDVLDSFGVAVVDEAHMICAPTFCKGLGRLRAARVLALSATPERPDGLHSSLRMLCGREVIRVQRPRDGAVLVCALRLRFGTRVVHRSRVNGKDQCNLARMLNELGADPARVQLLHAAVVAAVTHGRTVLVLSDRVTLTQTLCDLASAALPGVVCSAVTGKVPMRHRSALVAGARVLFATTGLAKLGLDKPELDTLIFATPVSGASVEQPVGRILRNGSSPHRPLIVDVVDTYSIFAALYAKRLGFYARQGYQRVEHTLLQSDDFRPAWLAA
jgi:superfamily II DNA or RNA helicase